MFTNNPDIINDIEPQREKIEEQLLNFCRAGNYIQVVHLFDKYFDNPGFDINCRDYDGNTPLILAAKQGHGSIIQELLRYVPDISCENRKGATIIHLSTNSIQKMIFGSVSSVIKYSDRLFCNACWLGNDEVINRFLNKNQLIKINQSNLVNNDGINCCQLVVKNLAQLETIAVNLKLSYKPAQVLQSLLNQFNLTDSSIAANENINLLHVVASKICKSASECARVLLKKNYEIFAGDKLEFTPIHVAARCGNVAVLELLLVRLEKSMNKLSIIDLQARGGSTALHLAAMEGREDCVRLLLRHGANPEITNSDNYLPIQLAKSVRVKNIFNAQQIANPSVKPPKLLPEISFVLHRSSTAIPLSAGNARISLVNREKSAEPAYCRTHREKSMSNPDIIDLDLFVSNQKFPLLSVKSLTKSAEFPIANDNPVFRHKLTSQSGGALGCVDEENFVESFEKPDEKEGEEIEKEDEEEVILIEEMKKKSNENTAKPKTGETVKNSTKKRATSGTGKNSQKNNNNKNATKTTKISKTAKKSENHGIREKGKSKIGETVGKSGISKNGGSQEKQISMGKQNQDFPQSVEPEVIYESDFHTDSEKSEGKLEFDLQSDDEENDLNRTLTVRMSVQIHDHIEWKKGEQLGKGSYGTVWKGMLENGQYIAVKEILIGDNRNECENIDPSDDCIKTPREIRREIEILQTIRHKNIVKYIGACDSETCIHIFMEFVSGGSISHILSKFGGFSENIIKIYMKQLVTAVAFLHNISIIHRDLKSANIMVTPKGIIKVVDFGCAKKMENFTPNTASMTQQSRLQGSVYWLAPEVINGSQHSDKSDIWSIGCTGIEMITTRPPWSDLHPFAAMFAIGTGNKPFNVAQCTTSNRATLSANICQFINSCLNRDVVSRVTAVQLLNSPFLE